MTGASNTGRYGAASGVRVPAAHEPTNPPKGQRHEVGVLKEIPKSFGSALRTGVGADRLMDMNNTANANNTAATVARVAFGWVGSVGGRAVTATFRTEAEAATAATQWNAR